MKFNLISLCIAILLFSSTVTSNKFFSEYQRNAAKSMKKALSTTSVEKSLSKTSAPPKDGCINLYTGSNYSVAGYTICEDNFDLKSQYSKTVKTLPFSMRLGKHITAVAYSGVKYTGSALEITKDIANISGTFKGGIYSIKINHIRTGQSGNFEKSNHGKNKFSLGDMDHSYISSDIKGNFVFPRDNPKWAEAGMVPSQNGNEEEKKDERFRMRTELQDAAQRLPRARALEIREHKNPIHKTLSDISRRLDHIEAKSNKKLPPIMRFMQKSESGNTKAGSESTLSTDSSHIQHIRDLEAKVQHLEGFLRPYDEIKKDMEFKMTQHENDLLSRIRGYEGKIDNFLRIRSPPAVACFVAKVNKVGQTMVKDTLMVWNRIEFNKDPGHFRLSPDRTTVQVLKNGLYKFDAKVTTQRSSYLHCILNINNESDYPFYASAQKGTFADATLSTYKNLHKDDHLAIFIGSLGNGANNELTGDIHRFCIRKME